MSLLCTFLWLIVFCSHLSHLTTPITSLPALSLPWFPGSLTPCLRRSHTPPTRAARIPGPGNATATVALFAAALCARTTSSSFLCPVTTRVAYRVVQGYNLYH